MFSSHLTHKVKALEFVLPYIIVIINILKINNRHCSEQHKEITFLAISFSGL